MNPAGLLAPRLLATQDDGPRPSRPSSEPPIELPEPRPCSHRPVLFVLLFDNSPSVTGGSDPVGNRFGEAAIALSRYSGRCRCGQELVALRTFDRNTSGDVGPLPLTDSGRRTLAAALAIPPELVRGTSRMRPSLAGIDRLIRSYPHHTPVLVVFSDFQLLDPDPAGVLERLCRFPGRVHAVVLDEEPPAALLDGPAVVHRVRRSSPRGEVARALIEALGDVSEGSGA